MNNDTVVQLELPFEEWRDVVGYEGIYRVSNTGRVQRIKNPRYMKGDLRQENLDERYWRVSLNVNGKRCRRLTHCIVMESFIGKCPENMEVNHKNGNGHDNNLSNLEYITHQANAIHAVMILGKHPPVGSDHYRTNLTDDDIRYIRNLYSDKKYNQREIGEIYSLSQSTISLIILRKNWGHVI